MAPIATGTPTPSTIACTASRSSARTTWYAALIEVRVVASVVVRSAMRTTPARANTPNDATPDPAATTRHDPEHSGHSCGVEGQPQT